MEIYSKRKITSRSQRSVLAPNWTCQYFLQLEIDFFFIPINSGEMVRPDTDLARSGVQRYRTGYSSRLPNQPNTLQQVRLPIINLRMCSHYWSRCRKLLILKLWRWAVLSEPLFRSASLISEINTGIRRIRGAPWHYRILLNPADFCRLPLD